MDFKNVIKRLDELQGQSLKDVVAEDKRSPKRWANEPEERVLDTEDMLATGDDLHKPKKSYPATQLGDNPMNAFESRLEDIKKDILGE